MAANKDSAIDRVREMLEQLDSDVFLRRLDEDAGMVSARQRQSHVHFTAGMAEAAERLRRALRSLPAEQAKH